MIKLHVGCGRIIKEGYINIDAKESKGIKLDLCCDSEKLPYENNTVDLIESYHMIEHLDRHKALRVLKHWFNILKPKCELIIECPDFLQAVNDYVKGNLDRINNIFGLQRHEYDFHKFGYSRESLQTILKQTGFSEVFHEAPTDYHSKDEPCLRIIGTK